MTNFTVSFRPANELVAQAIKEKRDSGVKGGMGKFINDAIEFYLKHHEKMQDIYERLEEIDKKLEGGTHLAIGVNEETSLKTVNEDEKHAELNGLLSSSIDSLSNFGE